jgi:hypothetical protein
MVLLHHAFLGLENGSGNPKLFIGDGKLSRTLLFLALALYLHKKSQHRANQN